MKSGILFFVLIILSSFRTVHAQSWAHYDTSNGMYAAGTFPNGALYATGDRYDNIWIAIGNGSMGDGLERFDGNNWTHFDTLTSNIPQNEVMAMIADTNGVLWMCFFQNLQNQLSGLTKFDGANWTSYDTVNSNIMSNEIFDVKVDDNNDIWILCADGVSKFDGINFTNYNYPGNYGRELAIQDPDNVWMASNTGLHHLEVSSGTWTNFNTSNSNIPSNYASCISIDNNGLIWLGFSWMFDGGLGSGGSNGGLASFNDTTFTSIWPLQNLATGVYDLAIDNTNNLWVATRCEGLYMYDGISWTNISGVPLNGCSYSVMVDRENFVWFTEVYSGIWTNNMSVGLNENPDLIQINVYPNPANDYFIVDYNFNETSELRLGNSLGQTLINISPGSVKTIKINSEQLSAGIYYWTLVEKNEVLKSGKISITK